jgi:4-hydroxy 2-oxovalerate aldolase
VAELAVPVGFHAHNNLGVAVTNALTAKDMGAKILDGSSMGLGAGAGNAQLENLAANLLSDRGDVDSIRVYLHLSRLVESIWSDFLPRISGGSIESALSGVFSGYAPQVAKLSEELGIDKSSLWKAIGKRKLVAGQESMIREIAQDLMNL